MLCGVSMFFAYSFVRWAVERATANVILCVIVRQLYWSLCVYMTDVAGCVWSRCSQPSRELSKVRLWIMRFWLTAVFLFTGWALLYDVVYWTSVILFGLFSNLPISLAHRGRSRGAGGHGPPIIWANLQTPIGHSPKSWFGSQYGTVASSSRHGIQISILWAGTEARKQEELWQKGHSA